MIETYRMLGHEHEADLAREAERRQQASLVHPKPERRLPVLITAWASLRRLAPAAVVRRESGLEM
jgi:hypothetical protein